MTAAEVALKSPLLPEAVKKSIHGSRASPRTDFCVSSFKHLAARPELYRRATAIFLQLPFFKGGTFFRYYFNPSLENF
jgi:hypothetical protein